MNAQDTDLRQAITERHSVRQYRKTPIPEDIKTILSDAVNEINTASGLNIQLIIDDRKALSNFMVTYGRFKDAVNYFSLVGPDDNFLLEKVGYYGEKLVLMCQTLGLNTCWVGGTFSKNEEKVTVGEGEKFVAIIAVGYGITQGTPHKSKPMEELAGSLDIAPQWYVDGVEAAMLGPSALNKQSFYFSYEDDTVSIKGTTGKYSEIDVGIAKLHFEIGSGKDATIWNKR